MLVLLAWKQMEHDFVNTIGLLESYSDIPDLASKQYFDLWVQHPYRFVGTNLPFKIISKEDV